MIATPTPPQITRIHEKWGPAATAGWLAVPDLLLKSQDKLELSPTEMLVLLNILSFWWYAHELPFPRPTTLAKRMNVTTRTVQRSIASLAEKGLISKRIIVTKDGTKREVIDPNGLVKRLNELGATDPVVRFRQGLREDQHGIKAS